MQRPRVYSKRETAADASVVEDEYFSKIVKYIPSEIVVAYVSLAGITDSVVKAGVHLWVQWVVFFILLAMTPIWILGTARRDGLPKPNFQAWAGFVAFAAWGFALGGPFEKVGWYNRTYGSILLILVTLFLPAFENFINKPHPNSVMG